MNLSKIQLVLADQKEILDGLLASETCHRAEEGLINLDSKLAQVVGNVASLGMAHEENRTVGVSPTGVVTADRPSCSCQRRSARRRRYGNSDNASSPTLRQYRILGIVAELGMETKGKRRPRRL